MVDYRAKIGGLPEDHPSPDEIRSLVQSYGVFLEDAKRWASARLLAYRIGDARSVMSLVLQREENPADDLRTRLSEKDVKMSEWEYETAFKNGHLGLGISLHGLLNAYRRNAGLQEKEISSEEFRACGECCTADGDWHNAIAAFERGKNTAELVQLAGRLEGSDDPSEKGYAALAWEVVEGMG